MKDNSMYQKLLIKEFDYWKIYLHENQFYLGRCYLWANREDALDFFDMTNEEMREYMGVGNSLRKVLRDVFNPDLFNYATLANEARHLHTHIIPRYESPREFEGITFTDGNFGRNFAPYNRGFKIPEDVIIKIREAIKSGFENQ